MADDADLAHEAGELARIFVTDILNLRATGMAGPIPIGEISERWNGPGGGDFAVYLIAALGSLVCEGVASAASATGGEAGFTERVAQVWADICATQALSDSDYDAKNPRP